MSLATSYFCAPRTHTPDETISRRGPRPRRRNGTAAAAEDNKSSEVYGR